MVSLRTLVLICASLVSSAALRAMDNPRVMPIPVAVTQLHILGQNVAQQEHIAEGAIGRMYFRALQGFVANAQQEQVPQLENDIVAGIILEAAYQEDEALGDAVAALLPNINAELALGQDNVNNQANQDAEQELFANAEDALAAFARRLEDEAVAEDLLNADLAFAQQLHDQLDAQDAAQERLNADMALAQQLHDEAEAQERLAADMALAQQLHDEAEAQERLAADMALAQQLQEQAEEQERLAAQAQADAEYAQQLAQQVDQEDQELQNDLRQIQELEARQQEEQRRVQEQADAQFAQNLAQENEELEAQLQQIQQLEEQERQAQLQQDEALAQLLAQQENIDADQALARELHEAQLNNQHAPAHADHDHHGHNHPAPAAQQPAPAPQQVNNMTLAQAALAGDLARVQELVNARGNVALGQFLRDNHGQAHTPWYAAAELANNPATPANQAAAINTVLGYVKNLMREQAHAENGASCPVCARDLRHAHDANRNAPSDDDTISDRDLTVTSYDCLELVCRPCKARILSPHEERVHVYMDQEGYDRANAEFLTNALNLSHDAPCPVCRITLQQDPANDIIVAVPNAAQPEQPINNRTLSEAAQVGDLPRVQQLIRLRGNIDLLEFLRTQDIHGNTPWQTAQERIGVWVPAAERAAIINVLRYIKSLVRDEHHRQLPADEQADPASCPICLSEFSDAAPAAGDPDRRLTICSYNRLHHMCADCVNRVPYHRCPECRGYINQDPAL